MVDADEMRVRLLLLVQRALLGSVPAALRQVTCDWQGGTIRLRFVCDGEIDGDDYECAQIAGTEVIADFHSPWMIEVFIVRLDYPADLRPGALELWAYARKE